VLRCRFESIQRQTVGERANTLVSQPDRLPDLSRSFTLSAAQLLGSNAIAFMSHDYNNQLTSNQPVTKLLQG
jgi:hypothetical protein